MEVSLLANSWSKSRRKYKKLHCFWEKNSVIWGMRKGVLCYGKINFWGWCDDFTAGNKTGRMRSL